MRRVAEIIHIEESRRETFIRVAVDPDQETLEALWLCGVRKQQYFALNDLLFMTFEYEGNDFAKDMNKMATYLDGKGLLVKQRRKDVPLEMRDRTDWWAPVKKLGDILTSNPIPPEESTETLAAMLDGAMKDTNDYNDIAFDEDDWSESFRF